MPIPTDTFWNIKRLNIVFALSAIALFGVTAWTILQDYGGYWRVPQKNARIWDAAITTDKISRDLTPADQKHLQDLQKQIADKQNELQNHDKNYSDLTAQRKHLESDRATLDFRVNNRKSNVQVLSANLQDALAADDEARAKKISAQLDPLAKELDEWNEELAKKLDDIKEVRQKLDDETAQLDALNKQKTALDGDVESLKKRLTALAPSGIARLSDFIRSMPLMGFINPSEKVQQIVLPDVQTDVAFMKITTVDRCTTCHVNITKKDFTEEKMLAYLEEEAGAARKISLPTQPGSRSALPQGTEANPGAVAFPEFWHHWAQKLAPEQIGKLATRFNTIKAQIGADKPIKVTYSGQLLTEFNYDTKLHGDESAKQDAILLAVIRALEEVPAPYEAARGTAEPVDLKYNDGPVTVAVTGKSTDSPIINARNAALKYIELLRDGVMSAISADQAKLLLSRYRYNLVDVVNPARRSQGLAALDPSEALLAHPRLDLYVDVDSPHSFEAVGCTSCHDGSGQETDFVLAAHSARDIFVDAKTGAPLPEAALSSPPPAPDQVGNLSSMLAAAETVKGLHFDSKPATQPAEEASSGESQRPIDYVDPATGKSSRAIKQFEYWVNTFEPKAPRGFELVYHEWDWPMRTPQYIQANCARCHTDVYDIKDTAPVLYEGRQLFTQFGCVNCHQMDSIPTYENRKIGTDLRHVTAKLSPAYINTWIWAPKAFRPTTKMPHFFMLENNSSDEEIRRTRQEARAITEYLVRTAEPLPPKYIYPAGGHGSVEAGKAIFNSMGCLACHQNLNERGEEWITTDMVKGTGMTDAAAKTAYGAMSYNERQLYVQQHLAEPYGHETKPTYPDGSAKPEFVQIGPELSGIGTKLTAGRTVEEARLWLFNWLKEPRHYSDYTIMPRLRVTDQQALDLAEYLLNQKRTTTDPNDKWEAGLTPIDTNKLIELTALQLKSRYSWQTAQIKADDDAELTADAQAALTTPVKSAADAKTEVASMDKDQKRLVFLGQKLIANYACMTCHAINGMETASSPCPNLSAEGQKGVDKLDFGYLDEHHVEEFRSDGVFEKPVMLVNGLSAQAANLVHEDIKGKPIAQPIDVTWPEVVHMRMSWIAEKLKNTRIYDRGRVLLEPDEAVKDPGKPYDKLKMPTFYLNDDQTHAIVTFVLSNRDRLISPTLTEKATNDQAKKIAHGRELTERYNCVACHQIEKNAPQIHQYYKLEDIPTAAPPSLRGEGNKIQFNWLFNFFKNVEQMRPLLFEGIHMPSFPATDEEFSSIITYFNAVSNKESKELSKQIDPVMKYVNFSRKATTQPVADPAAPQPGDDWWSKPEFAASARYLKDWGLTFGHIKPVEIGIGAPASPEDYRKVYAKLLFKAQFTRELYDAPFPFVDTPRPDITDARFALGQKFFYELQCLKCHVLGDPSVPGANAKPTAPNLSLASRRLQRNWIRHWVQEPNIIQVGTAMPPFFTGLPNDVPVNLHGQPWPLAQQTVRPADQIEADYGTTVDEETGLLLDFIYAAGVRGFTGVQPPTSQPAASP